MHRITVRLDQAGLDNLAAVQAEFNVDRSSAVRIALAETQRRQTRPLVRATV